jgi:anti-sigma factor RsiW
VAGSDCKSRREILDLYLDNELLVETSHSLLQHLSCCPDCAGELERRIELRRLLKATSTFDDQDESNSETILRKKIESALQKEQRRRMTARVRWVLLAASLLLVLGLGYWRYTNVPKPNNSAPIKMVVSNQVSNSGELVVAMDRDAVANHEACALKYPPNWTFDRQRIVRELTPGFASLIEVVGRTHNSYELIEGHICSYQQRQYAHLIFRGNGHTVSVFIEHYEPFGKPDSSPPAEVAHTRYSAYEVSRVDTTSDRIYLVSDLPSTENVALTKQLFPPTLRFVQKMKRGGA